MPLWLTFCIAALNVFLVARWIHLRRNIHIAFSISTTICATIFMYALTLGLPKKLLELFPLHSVQLFGALLGPALLFVGLKYISQHDDTPPVKQSDRIVFDCQNCGTELSVAQYVRGMPVKCSSCKAVAHVPNPNRLKHIQRTQPAGKPESIVDARSFKSLQLAQQAQIELGDAGIPAVLTRGHFGCELHFLHRDRTTEVMVQHQHWELAQDVLDDAGLLGT